MSFDDCNCVSVVFIADSILFVGILVADSNSGSSALSSSGLSGLSESGLVGLFSLSGL